MDDAFRNEALRILYNAIAAREGITVVFDKECEIPHASGARVITLPPPSALDSATYWFYAMHELGHLMEPMDWSYEPLTKVLNFDDPLVMAVTNILADYLCEQNLFGYYDGVNSILDVGRSAQTKRYLRKTEKKYIEISKDATSSLMFSLCMADAELRQPWMGYLMESLNVVDFNKTYFTEYQDEYKRINLGERLNSILGNEDPVTVMKELVLDILRIIKYKPPESEGKGEGEPCDACKGTGTDEKGEPCDACEGTGKMVDGLAEASEKDTDGIGKDGPSWEKGPEDLTKEELKEVLEAIKSRVTDKFRKKYRSPPYTRGSYIPWERHTIIELEKKHEDYKPLLRQSISTALGSSTVSKQVSKYLKAMVTESYTYGQKRGKLHGKNLHKLVSTKPQPGISPGIFKKKNSSLLRIDSAVSLVIDCSGSMSGSRYAIGAACCVALSDTLTSLTIPHEIIGFTEDDWLLTYVFKNFGTVFTRQKCLNVMANKQLRLLNNADGESVLWAAERLVKRKEKNKLMIVLSDGYPSGRYTGDGNMYLKHVCGLIETGSSIDLVGIGISTEAVRRFYKHYVVVNDPSELDHVLFGVLKKFLC